MLCKKTQMSPNQFLLYLTRSLYSHSHSHINISASVLNVLTPDKIEYIRIHIIILLSYCTSLHNNDRTSLAPHLSGLSGLWYKYLQARATPHSVCGESRHHEVLGGFLEKRKLILSLIQFNA